MIGNDIPFLVDCWVLLNYFSSAYNGYIEAEDGGDNKSIRVTCLTRDQRNKKYSQVKVKTRQTAIIHLKSVISHPLSTFEPSLK
jgi:hypothetical protein